MASPASEGSYHTPVHTDEAGEEVVRETSEETAVNTGDKGTNTQWVHAEHIEITVNK
jgi:hypothetical protein